MYDRIFVRGAILVVGDIVYGSAGRNLIGIQCHTVSKGQLAAKGRHETPE